MDMVASSNRVINSFPPLNNITPFTRVDGWSFLEVLEGLRNYIVNTLVPEIDDDFEKITIQLNEWFEQYTIDFQGLKDEWQKLFDDFMDDIVAQLEALNDQAMANLIRDIQSKTREALDEQYNLVYNVRSYGAKGDGVTNDQLAVQAAVDAMNGNPGVLGFPAGEYTWNEAIQLHSGVTVQSFGGELVKKTAGGNAAFFSLLSGEKRGYGSGGIGITFRDIKVTGSFSPLRQTALLAAHHGQDITVDNCTFIMCMHYGHTFDLQGCKNVVFKNCHWYGQFADPNYRYIEAIQLDNSSLTGASVADNPMSYDGLPTVNVTLQACSFMPYNDGTTTHPAPNPIGSHSGLEAQRFNNVKISDCVFYAGMTQDSGTHKGVIHIVNGGDVKISGCEFIGNGNAVSAVAFRSQSIGGQPGNAGIVPLPGVTWAEPMAPNHISIVNNKFVGFNSASGYESVIYVLGDSNMRGKDLEVSGNYFQNCRGGGATESVGGDLIQIRLVDGVSVKGNYSTESRRGVTVFECDNVEIQGNNFNNSSDNAGTINLSAVNGAVVSGNTVKSYAGFGVYLINCNRVVANGNNILSALGAASNGFQINKAKGLAMADNIVDGAFRGYVVYGGSTSGRLRNNIYKVTDVGVQINADSSTVGSVDNYELV